MTKTAPPPLGIIALLVNSAIEASIIFIPLFATELGASYFEVGIVGVSYGMAYFVSSFLFGWQSDRRGRVSFIKIGLGLATIAFFLQTLVYDLSSLIIVRGITGFCLGISSAVLLAYASETEGNIGIYSSYGSLGWVAGAVAAALIKEYDYLFSLSSLLCLTAFLLALRLREEATERKPILAHPGQVIIRNWKVYLPFFLRHLGATAIWIILPLFLVEIGATKLWIGILWMINFGGQFIAMRYAEKFHEAKLFSLGLILSGVVFLAYALSTHYWQIVPVQILLAIGWSSLYVGALVLLLRNGEEHGTSAGLLFSTISFCSALGPFVGGALSQALSFKATMLFGAIISLAGLPLALKNKKTK